MTNEYDKQLGHMQGTLDALEDQVVDLTNAVNKRNEEHENRIRSLEKTRNILIGGIIVAKTYLLGFSLFIGKKMGLL